MSDSGVGCHFLLQSMHAKLLKLGPTLCDPIDGSPPGSSVLGILHARVLEWGAIVFSGKLRLGEVNEFPKVPKWRTRP